MHSIGMIWQFGFENLWLSRASSMHNNNNNNNRDWKEKTLHGEFVRQTADVAGEDSWRWLRNGFLKKETEGLILAAQEQAFKNKRDQAQHR